jgi:hypothetical protein
VKNRSFKKSTLNCRSRSEGDRIYLSNLKPIEADEEFKLSLARLSPTDLAELLAAMEQEFQ